MNLNFTILIINDREVLNTTSSSVDSLKYWGIHVQ